MIRRWFIRIVFMLPILLCVGGWEWSNSYTLKTCFTHGFNLWYGTVAEGKLCVQWAQSDRLQAPWSWSAHSEEWYPDVWLEWRGAIGRRGSFLGFWIGEDLLTDGEGERSQGQWVAIPFWFPTILSALTLCYVWRKTQPKLNSKTAFPVEAAVTNG